MESEPDTAEFFAHAKSSLKFKLMHKYFSMLNRGTDGNMGIKPRLKMGVQNFMTLSL